MVHQPSPVTDAWSSSRYINTKNGFFRFFDMSCSWKQTNRKVFIEISVMSNGICIMPCFSGLFFDGKAVSSSDVCEEIVGM